MRSSRPSGFWQEALDELRCALLLINEHGTILHANRVAEHMLDEGGPVQSPQGVFRATAPSASSELRSALALAARTEAGIGKTGLRSVSPSPTCRPSSLPSCRSATARGRCRRIHRLATRRAGGRRRYGCRFWSDAGRTTTIGKPVRRAHTDRDCRNARHHLAAGENPLKHIFLRTRVTRQAELMCLWTGLISPTGSNM
jgi:hypothetical protein